ncbi:MAG: class II glutamine amidotransferase [Betaproteobacteria bacterium]|nr:class II glutamine amidotransferase [Betaproteobacteria bacterium]
MCQLLGMNCNTPTDVCFSFTGFHKRGGGTDQHADGWGIAFFEGKGCRVFLDPAPAVQSPIARLVREYPIRSMNVVAHIRKATQGPIALENTHPFMRELWGRYWIFAHNGNLKDFAPRLTGAFLPAGTTDSETAFCHLLDVLRIQFGDAQPARDGLTAAVARWAESVRAHGTFNFLLSNGVALFAHCSDRLAYLVREAPFTTAHLVDEDIYVDFSEVTTPEDRVAVIATVPLTDDEHWTALRPGELAVFHHGQRLLPPV